MDQLQQQLDSHYSRALDPQQLLAAVDQHLGSNLKCSQLAPVDQLHIGGRGASLKLLQGALLQPDMRVLDVGCGTGGSTRLLADEFGCQAIGIDLTSDFCHLARALNQRLESAVDANFVQGDALSLPFPDQSFDALLLQHCIMNLPDPALACREFYRVLKPGGQLLIHEVLLGNGGEPRYPVPWAFDAGQSFLIQPEQLQQWLQYAGFGIAQWQDETETALSWRKHHQQRDKKPTLLSPELIFGPDFKRMAANLIFNLQQHCIKVVGVQAVKG